MTAPHAMIWSLLGGSVQGANKKRNQDAFRHSGLGTSEAPLLLAAADGHGAAAHTRSARGAELAVELLTKEMGRFADLARARPGQRAPVLSWLRHYAEDALPRQFVTEWRRQVLRDWEEEHDPAADGLPVDKRLELYGTTVIGAVLTPQLLTAWQLGDGELSLVDEDGTVHLPLAPATAALGDESESLCLDEAWRLMRLHWEPLAGAHLAPVLLSLSTDGLSHSFVGDEGFRGFVRDLAGRTRGSREAVEAVREALPRWLSEASAHSGDDTTLVAAVRTNGTAGTDGEDGSGTAVPSPAGGPAAPVPASEGEEPVPAGSPAIEKKPGPGAGDRETS
ncbi:protein phosphatase 2C domain-containing protein [Streptomyces sp. P6-2-1]|uniref:protein phosphatase 2C domain-containing protein n=1 Tax=Streptomyces sp. P6-2-1 TaxID=3422591 RepID=UPI003D361AE3